MLCNNLGSRQRLSIIFILLFAVTTAAFIFFRSSMANTTYFTAGSWVKSFFTISENKYFTLLEDYGTYDDLAIVVDSDNPDELWEGLEMEAVVKDNDVYSIVLLNANEEIVCSAGKMNPKMLNADLGKIGEQVKFHHHYRYYKQYNDSLFTIFAVPVRRSDKSLYEAGGYLLAIGYVPHVAETILPSDLWTVEYLRERTEIKQSLNPVRINEFINGLDNRDYGVLQFQFSGSDAAIGKLFWIWYSVICALLLFGYLFIKHTCERKGTPLQNNMKVILETMPARCYAKNKNSQFEFVNTRFAESFGLKPDDFIGKDVKSMSLPEELNSVFSEDIQVINSGKERLLRMIYLKCFTDTEKCYSVSKTPYSTNGKQIDGVFCVMMDISKGIRTEQNIIEKNRLFQNTIDNLTDLYLRVNLEGIIIQASRSCCEAFGYDTVQEIIGQSIHTIVENSVDWNAVSLAGNVKDFAFKIKNRKNKTLFCEANINPFFDADGNVAGYEGIIHNVTERKQYEQQLQALTQNLMNSLEQTEEKNTQLENVHRRMEESLTYAKRIQDALFYSSTEKTRKVFPDHFALYLPCEIVGGDFYYITEIGDKKVCIVGDCTGHGVPGALMSVLSASLLTDIINAHGHEAGFSPAELLEDLRTKIIATLQNSVILRDGLDIAVLFVKQNKIEYAGANIPLVTVSNGVLDVYEPTKCPIGIYPMHLGFKNETIDTSEGDMVYIATDGFADQFGMSENRKFSRRDFYNLLSKNDSLPCSQQKQELEKALNIWRGARKQTDDITVFGIRM